MNYYAVTAFFNGLFGLFVVYYVFLRNPRNLLNQTFSYFGISVAGWSLIYALWCWADNAQDAERYIRLHMTFCSIIPATFFHFVSVLIKSEEKLQKWVFVNYGICSIFSVLCHTPLMIAGVKAILAFKHWPVPGIVLPLFVVYFSLLVMFCFILMGRHTLQSSGNERNQNLIILIGFIIGFSGGWTNWFLWFDIPIEPTANFFVGLLFATMLYAIVRYGVMDQDVLVELVRSNRLSHIGLLMTSINHEIKNPLYVIRGLAESHLSKERSNHNGQKELEELCLKTRDQVNRIVSIMQKFSSLVKNAEVKDNSSDQACVQKAVNNVMSLVAGQFRLEKINFSSNIPEGLPAIAMSPIHLEEVLLNLVMNAAQAVKAQAVTCAADGGATAIGNVSIVAVANHSYIEICVEDDGCGVKDLKSLFQVFSTTKPDGMGLGLYITKQLVEKYRGKITVQSKLGAGTRFSFKIPAFQSPSNLRIESTLPILESI